MTNENNKDQLEEYMSVSHLANSDNPFAHFVTVYFTKKNMARPMKK